MSSIFHNLIIQKSKFLSSHLLYAPLFFVCKTNYFQHCSFLSCTISDIVLPAAVFVLAGEGKCKRNLYMVPNALALYWLRSITLLLPNVKRTSAVHDPHQELNTKENPPMNMARCCQLTNTYSECTSFSLHEFRSSGCLFFVVMG